MTDFSNQTPYYFSRHNLLFFRLKSDDNCLYFHFNSDSHDMKNPNNSFPKWLRITFIVLAILMLLVLATSRFPFFRDFPAFHG